MIRSASLPWLLAQEGRVLWRGSMLLRSRRFVLFPVLAVGLIFQGIALELARIIIRHPIPAPEMILAANLNLVFLFGLMLARAITAAIDVLYARGDVDFLLAAPVPPGRILAARMLGVAASVAAPWGLLAGVLVNALAFRGQFWALAAYPMLAATGLLAASLAFTVAVVLSGFMRPGHARRLGHLLSLVVGLAIFSLGQAPRFIPAAAMVRLWRSMTPGADPHAAIWLPARAMLGAPCPLIACLGGALLTFLAVWAGLANRFANGAISAAAYRPGGGTLRRPSRFPRHEFTAACSFNARLLARFPGLATQIVYRSLALVPVLMILSGSVRFNAGASPSIVAPLLVFLAGQLGLFFASVLTAADQSPDLAASAPTALGTLRAARFITAATAVLALMALPFAAVAARAPHLLPPLLAGLAASLAAALRLGETFPIPLTRAAFGKTQPGSVVGLILGVAISSACAFVVWAAT